MCDGGRIRSPGAVGDADVTHKCRNCEVMGQHGDGWLYTECAGCLGTGRVNCQNCGGMFGKREGGGSVPASGVFSTDSCGACSGSGWVHPRMAAACEKCAGLGVLVRPASDSSKTFR